MGDVLAFTSEDGGTVLVETTDQATEVLRALDAPGRVLVLDVERKQDVDLLAVAREVVSSARVVPTKPNDALAPVPSAPFQLTLVADTCEPDVVTSAFQACWILWSEDGHVHVTFHDEIAEPRLVTFTSPWNSPGHWFWTV